MLKLGAKAEVEAGTLSCYWNPYLLRVGFQARANSGAEIGLKTRAGAK